MTKINVVRPSKIRLVLISSLISLVIFVYPSIRTGLWLGLPLWLISSISTTLFSSQLIARMVLREKINLPTKAVKRLADFILGLAPVWLISVLIGEIVIALGMNPLWVAYGVLITCVLYSFIATANAITTKVINVELSSKKIVTSLKFVQISDVHIGSRSSVFLDRLINKIIKLDPDFLCITGDFIDKPNIDEQQLQALSRFKKPIYFCIGNHERYEDLEDICRRLESLGVVVLRNRSIATELYDNKVQIIGIDDAQHSEQVANELSNIDIEPSHYTILLYHRPHGLEAASQYGIDLKLSGHTHNGQIMPFNLLVNRVFKYRQGLYKHNDTHLYVNQGTGTWGPVMRFGTHNEITHFKITSDT